MPPSDGPEQPVSAGAIGELRPDLGADSTGLSARSVERLQHLPVRSRRQHDRTGAKRSEARVVRRTGSAHRHDLKSRHYCPISLRLWAVQALIDGNQALDRNAESAGLRQVEVEARPGPSRYVGGFFRLGARPTGRVEAVFFSFRQAPCRGPVPVHERVTGSPDADPGPEPSALMGLHPVREASRRGRPGWDPPAGEPRSGLPRCRRLRPWPHGSERGTRSGRPA